MDNELKDELCCPICTDLFDSPLRLPCGHSYCRNCLKAMVRHPEPRTRLQRLYEDEEQIVLSCPECRRGFIMNEQGVDRFQSDFKLAKLVELYKRLEVTSLTDSESETADVTSNNDEDISNRNSVLSVASTVSETRPSMQSTEVCEVLSNVPTELCADTLVKQVETDMPVEEHSFDAREDCGGACGGASLGSVSLPSVSATATVSDTIPEFHDNYFSRVINGESGEVESCQAVETGEVEICSSRDNGPCQTFRQSLDLERREEVPPVQLFSGPYDNLGASATSSQGEQISRHRSASPKFSSGNYDNVIDTAEVNKIVASSSDISQISALNNPVLAGSTNQIRRNNESSQSLTSSNSRSSKSTNETQDGSRKQSGAVSLGCSSRQTNSSDDSKHKESDSSDDEDDSRMTSSVVVKPARRKRKKKKKNRVASFFSSLLFSSSSSSDESLNSEEERKRLEKKRESTLYMFYSSSSTSD
ncbi:uncharacterized protein DDB_G0271670 [Patella vulgata]|uniref:uncharacterized protein DDB_G0271670 n=1 Tax=Patella vulgata TaxID=6465 RepID=UPI00217F6087|nr:uncharacterized protein DDB_G0271670 [Patella vulgata]XP_050412629.1 uncharacterized protein DDB_G0271670 [Patella vulgata]